MAKDPQTNVFYPPPPLLAPPLLATPDSRMSPGIPPPSPATQGTIRRRTVDNAKCVVKQVVPIVRFDSGPWGPPFYNKRLVYSA